MRERNGRRHGPFREFRLAAGVALLAASPCALGSGVPGGGLRVSGPALTNLVTRAGTIAFEKLGKSECRLVLLDFRDPAGRPLAFRLEALGRTAKEFFAELTFLDGRAWRRCGNGSTAAGANPGVPVVAICPREFERILARSPGLAADLLIHEMLHALGLGENPPASEEITAAVVRRCGM